MIYSLTLKHIYVKRICSSVCQGTQAGRIFKILEIYLFIPIGAKCDPDKNKCLDNQSTYHSTPYSLHMHVWCEHTQWIISAVDRYLFQFEQHARETRKGSQISFNLPWHPGQSGTPGRSLGGSRCRSSRRCSHTPRTLANRSQPPPLRN
jgi:hypothetical protein